MRAAGCIAKMFRVSWHSLEEVSALTRSRPPECTETRHQDRRSNRGAGGLPAQLQRL